MRKYSSALIDQLISLIQEARRFFDKNATSEILAEWLELLDPQSSTFILGHCLVTLFLPVQHGQHDSWIDQIFDALLSQDLDQIEVLSNAEEKFWDLTSKQPFD